LWLLAGFCVLLASISFAFDMRIGSSPVPLWGLFATNAVIAVVGGTIVALRPEPEPAVPTPRMTLPERQELSRLRVEVRRLRSQRVRPAGAVATPADPERSPAAPRSVVPATPGVTATTLPEQTGLDSPSPPDFRETPMPETEPARARPATASAAPFEGPAESLASASPAATSIASSFAFAPTLVQGTPGSRRRRSTAPIEASESEEALREDLRKALEILKQTAPAEAPTPKEVAPPVEWRELPCAGCRTLTRTDGKVGACESCGLAVCSDCRIKSRARGHPGVCPSCADLIEAAASS
jgi:pyruvate/2-oxoglutarate dehydrogenase complex dihydrolipoamide acyltransferase (E2) component